jgi:cell division inhibitor SepF
MMNVLQRLQSYMFGQQAEDYEDYDYDDEEESSESARETVNSDGRYATTRPPRQVSSAAPRQTAGATHIMNVQTRINSQVVVTYPSTLDEAGPMCDYLKENKTLIVNLEGTEGPVAQRIVDFLGGVIYALDGTIQCVSSKIFLLAPQGVDVTGNFKDDLKAAGLFASIRSSLRI